MGNPSKVMDTKKIQEALDEALQEPQNNEAQKGKKGKDEKASAQERQSQKENLSKEEKIKVGDVQLTREELLAKLEKLREVEAIEKKHGDLLELKREFTRRSQKLKELQKRLEELEGKLASGEITSAGKRGAERQIKREYDEETRKIRESAKKYGFILDEDLASLQQAIKRDVEELKALLQKERGSQQPQKQTQPDQEQEFVKGFEEKIKKIKEAYPFVNRVEVYDYMEEQARSGRGLSVDQAVKELYIDKIVDYKLAKALKRVPETDTGGGGEIEVVEENPVKLAGNRKALYKKLKAELEAELQKPRL